MFESTLTLTVSAAWNSGSAANRSHASDAPANEGMRRSDSDDLLFDSSYDGRHSQ